MLRRTPATSVSARRHSPSKRTHQRAPRQDAARAYALLRRMSTGRWPAWRILGTIPPDRDPVLVVGVEWLRSSDPRFTVVRISLDGRSVNWTLCATSAEVIDLLEDRVHVAQIREVA